MAGPTEVPKTQQAFGRGGSPTNGATTPRPRPPGPNDVKTGNGQPPKRNPLMRPRPWWISFILILILNYFLVQTFLPERANQRIDVPYTYFKAQVTADNVVDVTSRGDIIQGTFKQPVTYPPDQANAPSSNLFQTVMPQFADTGLETLLEQHGVTINARSLDEPRSWWQTLLLSFGPTLLLIGIFFWISTRAASAMGGSGGPFGLGRSRAKRYDQENQVRITFSDVAGIDEAKAELEEIVDFLKDPAKYTRLGGAAPKGVLLVGAPGTGKTLLARAVAGEANVPFFSMGASEFVEMIVGVGASRVRDLFKQAREAAPAIIFIDELDAIGRARGSGSFGGNDEREQTLNQILTEMDGFSSREGVIVLAATNRPDVLDQALLRPGRFDRRVTVNPPDKVGREAILRVHTRGVPLSTDVNLKVIAASTPGLVGADLRNLVNEAALLAARRNQNDVTHVDFMDALEKLVLGPARNLVMTPAERERVAYHEGGHTILGLLVPFADPVNRVTIMPRGQALGVTYQRPDDDRHNYSEEYLRSRITGAMGGRAAEEVVYGGRTTGAENDIQQATDLARQMVTRWGMSERLGPVTLAPRDDPFLGNTVGGFGGSKPYSEVTAEAIDAEVERILQECYTDGLRLLRDHREQLDRLARALLERETLDEQEIITVSGIRPAPRSNEMPEAAIPAAAAFKSTD
ncbi:MAG TPA: ATP-dependent zinc metalloprotease FtsH [Chloroflexota bacterium]|nr:ATP-dependent zinc metalloprotease FtsH [Chloroflexota bacterium]